jgi:uncharacterized membrane protein
MSERFGGAVAAPSTAATEETVTIRRIAIADLRTALEKGIDDFRAIPTHAFFVGIIYAVLGLVIIRWSFQYSLLPLVFPLIAGFVLLGPLAAIGLYELSRRREAGEEARFWHMFAVRHAPNRGAILRLGLGVALLFLAWLWVALALYRATFGELEIALGVFVAELFTTGHGWTLIVVGNLIGALFALAILAGTAVAFPMLVDRKVDVATAVATSLRVFAANPVPMLAWGVIVGGGLFIGAVPFLLGLLVVLPVLGHATWHLYRRVVG